MSEEPPKPKAKRAPKPKRPAHLPHGRWLGDLGDLSAFEKRLVAACARGEVCSPDDWDGERPEAEAATEANTIRAELIRFLSLGGDNQHPVHEQGVMLYGGWIKGTLSLHDATAVVGLKLECCHLDNEPVFISAKLPQLALIGSKMPGLEADGIIVEGDLLLCGGFEASGEVRLLGALIGGDLDCSKGKFSNLGRNALIADGMAVKGSVFLCDGFEVEGLVRLHGAQIGSDLQCNDSKFSSRGEMVLGAQGMIVKGGVMLRHATINGGIELTAAQIGTLVDDISCWSADGHVVDGLHYDRIIGPTDASMRIGWLKKQRLSHLTSDFRPQPWEQLIKVLREMGHPYDAAQVAMAKQKQLRKARQIKGPVRNIMHWLYGALAGYGHRPIWTVGWMAAVWLACALVFSTAAHYGAIGPTAPVMMVNQQVASCGVDGEVDFNHYWARCPDMPPEYTSFNSLLYSLDLILPLVDLQQDSDWAPVITNSKGMGLPLGWWARSLMWFEVLFGWMASLTLVAVLGRLVDKD